MGTEPPPTPSACPAAEQCWGVPSLLEAWAEAGDWLSRMQRVMQSPFSLLRTQISPTCRLVFDKGGSLPPAAFLLARLAQQLAGICSSSSFARSSAAEILPKAESPSDSHYPCVSAGWICRDGSCPPLCGSWVMPCWGITSPGPARLATPSAFKMQGLGLV